MDDDSCATMLNGSFHSGELWINAQSLLASLKEMQKIWEGQVVTAETVTDEIYRSISLWIMEWDISKTPEDVALERLRQFLKDDGYFSE